jgi:arsenate reductase
MLTLYGIPNCDTVKKARAWLAARGVAHHFHDFKQQPPDADRLGAWSQRVGWQQLLNRAGTTWRRLPDGERAAAGDEAGALALLQRAPSLIKRPVVEWRGGAVTVGFDAADWARRL